MLTLAVFNAVQAAVQARGQTEQEDTQHEAPAANAMTEMMQLIHEGHLKHQFNDGNLLVVTPQAVHELVGSCMLDKVLGIMGSDLDLVALNDFKTDLVACCTKSEDAEDEASCVKDSSKAYSLLSDMMEISDMPEKQKLGAQASALLIRAANKRLKVDQLQEQYQALLQICSWKDWTTCTWHDVVDGKEM